MFAATSRVVKILNRPRVRPVISYGNTVVVQLTHNHEIEGWNSATKSRKEKMAGKVCPCLPESKTKKWPKSFVTFVPGENGFELCDGWAGLQLERRSNIGRRNAIFQKFRSFGKKWFALNCAALITQNTLIILSHIFAKYYCRFHWKFGKK